VIQAEALCAHAARLLDERGHAVLLGPTIPFGHSPTHETFPGFVSLAPETLSALVVDVVGSLARQGFERQVLVNLGPGNWPAVQTAAYHVFRQQQAQLYVFGALEAVRSVMGDILEGHRPAEGRIDAHAGELETSVMLAVEPASVRMEAGTAHASTLLAELQRLPQANTTTNQKMMAIGLWDWSRFGDDGVTGDATLATSEKGERLLARTAEALAEHVVRYVLDR
jgi:creatinine amidohydrolase